MDGSTWGFDSEFFWIFADGAGPNQGAGKLGSPACGFEGDLKSFGGHADGNGRQNDRALLNLFRFKRPARIPLPAGGMSQSPYRAVRACQELTWRPRRRLDSSKNAERMANRTAAGAMKEFLERGAGFCWETGGVPGCEGLSSATGRSFMNFSVELRIELSAPARSAGGSVPQDLTLPLPGCAKRRRTDPVGRRRRREATREAESGRTIRISQRRAGANRG
jgi:hypothetical protein